MNKYFPDEALQAFGAMALSRQASVQLKASLERVPELKKIADQSGGAQKSSLNPFDVEIAGDEDEIQDWLYEGFLTPDQIGDIKKPVFPIPDLPPRDPCEGIRDALRAAIMTVWLQNQTVANLQTLVDAFDKNAHPIVVVFKALFAAGLEQAEAELAAAQETLRNLQAAARESGCSIWEVRIRRN